jgi:hypothetical protein
VVVSRVGQEDVDRREFVASSTDALCMPMPRFCCMFITPGSAIYAIVAIITIVAIPQYRPSDFRAL